MFASILPQRLDEGATPTFAGVGVGAQNSGNYPLEVVASSFGVSISASPGASGARLLLSANQLSAFSSGGPGADLYLNDGGGNVRILQNGAGSVSVRGGGLAGSLNVGTGGLTTVPNLVLVASSLQAANCLETRESDSVTVRTVIDANGHVGVRIQPESELHVFGNVLVESSFFFRSKNAGGAQVNLLGFIGGDVLQVGSGSNGGIALYSGNAAPALTLSTANAATFTGAIQPASLADASAPNNALYFSTDQASLAYKTASGTVEPLPGAGGGGGSTSDDTYSAVNKDTVTIPAGGACATDSSGVGVVRASAADGTKPCVGLAQASTANGFAATVQTNGTFTLADWTAVTGAASLAAKATYFLDPTNPGRLTNVAPTTPGQVVQIVGVAVSPSTLDLNPEPPVLL